MISSCCIPTVCHLPSALHVLQFILNFSLSSVSANRRGIDNTSFETLEEKGIISLPWLPPPFVSSLLPLCCKWHSAAVQAVRVNMRKPTINSTRKKDSFNEVQQPEMTKSHIWIKFLELSNFLRSVGCR